MLRLQELARHMDPEAAPDCKLDGIDVRKLQRRFCSGRLVKPWGLMKNGDLILLALRFILAKGPHALDFQKVKGHATLEHIQAGLSTYEHKHGNDAADKAAEEAIHLLQPHIYEIVT